jgi:hypothetical protein
VLNPLDDYPVHQTPEPLAHPASGDRNVYDRYFFNGYDREGGLFFAAAMGLYPNRQVIDASFSVVRNGVQRSVFGSGRAPADRTHTAVGPVRVEVVEPLRTLRLIVDGGGHGVAADLTFTARTVAVEEPRFTRHNGTRVVMDYTRLAQWGGWSGWLDVDGERVDVSADAVVGSRDRSWGIRGVGEPEGGAPSLQLPQFFWLWAPLNFDDVCTHFDVQELADGRRWHKNGAVIPVIGEGDPTLDTAGTVEPMHDVDWSIDWEPGTRRARSASVTLIPWRADPVRIELTPLLTFQMMGIGYFNAEWAHGLWKGESATGGAVWKLDELDPLDMRHFHVQQLVRAEMDGKVGVGVLEQLVIGPHEPSGFTEFFDGA